MNDLQCKSGLLASKGYARARIRVRLNRIRLGKFGDCRSVGKGVNEIKIDYDPGSRVYFGRSDFTVGILLCGGTKKECDYERSGTRFVSLKPDNFSHSSNLTVPKTWAADEPAKWNIAGNPELIWTKKCF